MNESRIVCVCNAPMAHSFLVLWWWVSITIWPFLAAVMSGRKYCNTLTVSSDWWGGEGGRGVTRLELSWAGRTRTYSAVGRKEGKKTNKQIMKQQQIRALFGSACKWPVCLSIECCLDYVQYLVIWNSSKTLFLFGLASFSSPHNLFSLNERESATSSRNVNKEERGWDSLCL